VPTGDRIGTAGEQGSPLLTDTHVHLNLKAYRKDRTEAIARAKAGGVGFIINVGFDLDTGRESIALAREHEFIRASVGLHPHGASEMDDDTFAQLSELASHASVVAVGETGLDYFYDNSPRPVQQQALQRQLQLARRHGRPLVVHNRDSEADMARLLAAETSGVRLVLHAFTGAPALL